LRHIETLGLLDNTHASAAKVLDEPVVRNRPTNEGSHDSSNKWRDGVKIDQNKRIVKREMCGGQESGGQECRI